MSKLRRAHSLIPSQLTLLAAILTAGLAAIAVGGEVVSLVLIVMLPVTAVTAALSLAYMVYVYRRIDPPRPLFLSMLIGASFTKLLAALGIGYLALASIANRVGLELPIPGTPEQRTAFVALAILALMTPPIYYALTMYIGRRKNGNIG